MNPQQAAALWNHMVWSDFGKAFECVSGFSSLYRLQEVVGNSPESLESCAKTLEDWALNFRLWVDEEKLRPEDEPRTRKKNKVTEEIKVEGI